jgi:hypothetical protein
MRDHLFVKELFADYLVPYSVLTNNFARGSIFRKPLLKQWQDKTYDKIACLSNI